MRMMFGRVVAADAEPINATSANREAARRVSFMGRLLGRPFGGLVRFRGGVRRCVLLSLRAVLLLQASPVRGEFADLFRLRRSEVPGLSAVRREIVEFPRRIGGSDEFPIADAQRAISLVEEP